MYYIWNIINKCCHLFFYIQLSYSNWSVFVCRSSGATGYYAHGVNGIWDRSEEVTEGLPVYLKRGDATKCLEYYAASVVQQ